MTETFTAEDFDAEKIVLMAKKAGMKYITLTTKHHEGFDLFDSCGLRDFDAPHSAAKRDLIREFVDACNKHDIKPFFYYATLDWHYSDEFENDFDAYLEILRTDVELLCKNYGPIGGLWFDGNWSRPADTDWKLDDLYGTIRKYQPEAMIINNTGMSSRGKIAHPEIDSVTFEQGHPEPMNRAGMDKYVTTEMCYTLNDHWGIGYNDIDYKSPKHLIESLCMCRKVGSNFLLNIGPEAQGAVNPMQYCILEQIGRWMDKFGEAIYDSKPLEYTAWSCGRSFLTKGEGCLYLFAFDLGRFGDKHVTTSGGYSGPYAFGGVEDKIKSITWMDNDEKLNFVQKDDMLCVDMTGFKYGDSWCVRVAKLELQ